MNVYCITFYNISCFNGSIYIVFSLLLRKVKMVDIVMHTMPAESEVHVAGNFLTKILRSSMRKNHFKGRNESSCRRHSLHCAKSTDNPTIYTPKSGPNPVPDPTSETKYDAGSPSKDFTSCWGLTNLRQVSCQLSSIGNMESVAPSSHSLSKEHPLSSKSTGGVDHPVLESVNSKPTSACNPFLSGTADHSAPRASTEGMFYKGIPSNLGVPSDFHRCLQIPIGNGGRVSPNVEEQASFKLSSNGKSNHRPVWHIPENKMSTTQAPSPPLRSDSFTATRVHEKSLVGSFPEGLSVHPSKKPYCQAVDGHEARLGYNPPPKKDFLQPYLLVKDYPNELIPTKLFSNSSTDVKQGQNPFTYELQHQRQNRDDRTFSAYPKYACSPKTQSVGSYYQSLQDLPTNTGRRNQTRTSMAFEPNHEGQAHFRYYCITAQQPYLESPMQGWLGDERRSKMGTSQGATNRTFVGSQKVVKTEYTQPYLKVCESKNSNGYSKDAISPPLSQAMSPVTNHLISKSSSGERETPMKKEGVKLQSSRHVPNLQMEQKNSVSTYQQDNPWIIKQDHNICPHKTPKLHSFVQEGKKMEEKSVTSKGGGQKSSEAICDKQGRQSDRYATTLRNKIQQKKAQLQKSRSATTLTCSSEVEEDSDIWKSNETSTSSSDGSFSNTYKDHLKEAQTKVLKATSFMRRDLELPGNEVVPGQLTKKTGPVQGQVTHIGGRKRFPMNKKMYSFSEPNKINEVGVEDKAAGSFVDRHNFFEGSCKPVLQKPIPKQTLLSPTEDHSERTTRLTEDSENISQSPLKESKSSNADLNTEEQQQLGTFAEYEATWKMQKKLVERITTGRYHSAENILDSGFEESNSRVCIHERSCSSPSAEFYGQKTHLPPRKFLVESPSDPKDQQDKRIPSVSEKVHGPPNNSKPLKSFTLNFLKSDADPLSSNQKSRLDKRHSSPLFSHHFQVPMSEQLFPKNKSPEPPRSAQPRQQETTCPFRASQEVRIQTNSPEPNQGPCPSEHLEKDKSPTAAPEDNQRSDTEGMLSHRLCLLGHSSISSKQNVDLTVTSANRMGSPSLRFLLQRLTDEPSATVQKRDPCSNKMEETSKPNTSGWKVPIQIICTENISEGENRNYPPYGESSGGYEVPKTGQLKKLDSPEQSKSPFIAYTRLEPIRNLEHETDKTVLDNKVQVRSNGVDEHSEEDLKREELARDIMGIDKSLVDILDQSNMKTTMDLMEGIFPQGEQLLEGAQPRRKAASKQTSPKNTQQRVEDNLASSVSLVSSSSYYSTSAPKAELLIKMKDMQEHMEEQDSEDELDYDLSNKKQELIDSLSKKLQVLREARESLQEDVQDNNVLGEEVEATVLTVCKPNELEKFCMFVGDLEKVVSLLLSLSGRLARVENALNNLEEGISLDEKHTLTEKRKLLIRQHEDAKELKENLDRRERLVYEILASHLNEERLADYQHFVKMKSALIIEQRKLEDKIKLGEEQLRCLKDNLSLDQRLLH
ncbi:protein Shroom2 isoform X4 [Carassius gibelio]|uniref:protein Shroom2 isoform X4 n=2 Tax=Carassius gibelio TaxID=101364 RepID=UPI002277F1A6|nr:protein Shroom2 isoform X4 [Carassius gibelio]